MSHSKPPLPTHIAGTQKGEELTLTQGKEPGRGDDSHYRTARDATGINAKNRDPIDPKMGWLPPS